MVIHRVYFPRGVIVQGLGSCVVFDVRECLRQARQVGHSSDSVGCASEDHRKPARVLQRRSFAYDDINKYHVELSFHFWFLGHKLTYALSFLIILLQKHEFLKTRPQDLPTGAAC